MIVVAVLCYACMLVIEMFGRTSFPPLGQEANHTVMVCSCVVYCFRSCFQLDMQWFASHTRNVVLYGMMLCWTSSQADNERDQRYS